MYKFFLNGTKVKEPIGFQGITFEKTRSEVFGGFVFGAFGYSEGFKDLTFYDEVSIRILRDELQQKGLNAEIEFECTYCDNVVFSGLVDVLSVRFEEQKISCAMTDNTQAGRLMSRYEIDYAIEPTMNVLLHSKRLANVVSHTITEEIQFRRVANVGVSVLHYVPFTLTEGGIEGGGSMSFSGGSLLRSPANKKYQLSGILKWRTETANDFSYTLDLVYGNNNVRFLGTYLATTTGEEEALYISEVIELEAGEGVVLRVSGGVEMDFRFVYDTDSFLTIEEMETVEDSNCVGILASDAFESLVGKIGEGKIGFRNEFDDLEFDFLTSGQNIRGFAKRINVSLQFLFENLKKMYDLEAELSGGVLRIYKASEAVEYAFYLQEIKDYTHFVDSGMVYSAVKVGYNTWQSESKMKDAEYNSMREYSTSVSSVSAVLDLTNELITGGYLIEETRRIQYDEKKKSEEWKHDESLFLVRLAADKSRAARNEGIGAMMNVIDEKTAYNIAYSPARILENNARKVAFLDLEFQSGTGNYEMQAGGIAENRNFVKTKQGIPKRATFRVLMKFEAFNELGSVVSYEACGAYIFGKVITVKWSEQRNGLGWAEFLVEEVI
jgi:hypothetical protein